MFNNASNIDASHSTFNEVHRDQHIHSGTHVQGNYTVNTIVHGNQILGRSLGLENLQRVSVPGAAFDSIGRHPAPTCLPGTRLKLLAHITEWVDNPNCDQRLCWLSGQAGCGKSAIAQSIAEKYASQHRLAASFFFSRKEILRRKAHRFFPTLACQMLAFAPSIEPALLDALNADSTIPSKVLLEQARRLLQEPIMSSSTSFSNPILIVVDSLDECDDVKMANEIVHLLSRISHRCSWPLKVLFTSRAEPHGEPQSMTHSLQLRDFDVDDDIRSYLRHSFENIRESMNELSIKDCPAPWPSEDDLDLIMKNAAGLFIFATTVVKYVDTDYGSPVIQLQELLQAFRNGGRADSAFLHSSLDALYMDALGTIPDMEKVRSTLGLVVFAFWPLSTRGLNDLLWNSQFDTSHIAKSLCSVLVISNSDSDTHGDGAVRIYHTSFRDFLTSPHRSQQYFVDHVDFHSMLARACLELMIRHLTVDMCDVGDPSVRNSEIEDLEERCNLRIKEGVRYACRWFAHHLSQVPWDQGTNDALVLSLQGFARGYLLSWIEVLSLTDELDSAVLSLRETVDWLKCSPKPCEETLTLLHDAERLVLMFYDSFEQAALQVYYSLPCIPTDVQLRSAYEHELKNKFVITHGLDEYWRPCLRSVPAGSTIQSLAISSSGRLMASAGDTPGVELWDTLTGSNVGHFSGDGASSSPVVFSPSGDYVAIGYDTGAVDTWDVTTGQSILHADQSAHTASVTVLAFSRDDSLVVSGDANGTAHIWETSAGTLQHSLAHHTRSILCLSFSPDDGSIVSGSENASIVMSNVLSGQFVRRFRGHTSRVNSIAFAPDGDSFASGSDDESVRLWDTRTGVCLRMFTGMHKKPILHVWITADSKYIVSVCNMDVYMWETHSQSRKSAHHFWSVNHYYRKTASLFPAWYWKLARFVPTSLVARLCETDDGTILYPVPSLDGYAIGIAYRESVLYLEHFAPRTGWSKLRHSLAPSSTLDEPPLVADSGDLFTAIAMSLDSTFLATSSKSGDIKLWHTFPKSSWKIHAKDLKNTVNDFYPAPDGHSLLVKPMAGLQLFMADGTMVKDPETGGEIFGPTDAVPSPDSQYFAYWAEYTWNTDKSFSVHIYNASTGIRLKRIPGFFNITCGEFSAKGELFACAHGEGVVQIWELPSVLCKTTITTGHIAVTAMKFVPEALTVALGSDKGCVEIRSMVTGDVVHRVECSSSKVSALAVPEGRLVIIVGHENGSLFVWDPSFADALPYCLLNPEEGEETSHRSDGDTIQFVKFTEGHQIVCSRSSSGVICTWNLTNCHASFVDQTKKPVEDGSDDEPETTEAHGSPSRSDGVSIPATHDDDDRQDEDDTLRTEEMPEKNVDSDTDDASSHGIEHNTNGEPSPNARLESQDEYKEHDNAELDSDEPDNAEPNGDSIPHLVSRSNSGIVYDRYFRSTYAIDIRQGWVYRGSRRLFWLPSDMRPNVPTGLSAFEDQLVILTRLRTVVFFDLRPMFLPKQTLGSSGGEWK